RMRPFIAEIRKYQPVTPIIMVESPIFPLMRFNTETFATITAKNAALRKIFDELTAAGDKNLTYYYGKDVLGDCVEGTVDNYHFTDLGFTVFANNLAPVIRALMD
ncbi:MAG: SGNH/GDSL hydrolase family protein, partial [Muribaculaceae bacterium]